MDNSPSILPELIAFLNALSLLLLLLGFIFVKRRWLKLHRLVMMAAVISSTLFLAVYLLHHYQVGSVPYPYHDWTRTLYFLILIPHVILAVLILPFVFLAVRYGYKNELEKHKRITKYLFPVWVYVSATGLIVYYMLYHL